MWRFKSQVSRLCEACNLSFGAARGCSDLEEGVTIYEEAMGLGFDPREEPLIASPGG